MPDMYLFRILDRERVDIGPNSPVREVRELLYPTIFRWAGNALNFMEPSGSFAKGTANRSGTDIDLFISVSERSPATLKHMYFSLKEQLRLEGIVARPQNVSLGVKVGGLDVDLVPAKRQAALSTDHSLYRRKADTWTKTNLHTHVNTILGSGRQYEIRLLKLWRDQEGLDFPSFYLELSVLRALGTQQASVSHNMLTIFEYLARYFTSARIVDPANQNNVISDELSDVDRARIGRAAALAVQARNWGEIIR